ncbi:MAG: AAA family ATPase [Cyclobacteriaceae bacterium]
MDSALTFHNIAAWLQHNDEEIFISYKNWKEPYGYEGLKDDVNSILEQAAFDSETGYLTKKKIERIGKEMSRDEDSHEALGQKMILVKGKAGSGKTTKLLSLNFDALNQGFNSLFLTYNRLLVYDLSQYVKPIVRSKELEKVASFDTLHRFFYHLSKSLGVLHVMSDQRISELLDTLKRRLRTIYDFVSPQIDFNAKPNFEKIKEEIQNDYDLDKGTKEVGIEFMNFLGWKKVTSREVLNKVSTEFYRIKEERLANISAESIFLADYYGVLKNTLLQIQNSDKFYDQFDIESKSDLLDLATGAGHIYQNEEGIIEKDKFAEFKNRRVGGRRHNRIVFIDEGQDCHRLEKEILAAIFGPEHLVIADGGKEQLIRHVEQCNWLAIQGKRIPALVKNKRNRSYRIKPHLAHFCNFIAEHYKIDLKLESTQTEDTGELIFDFRSDVKDADVHNLFDQLMAKAGVYGCKEYESILVLLDSLEKANGRGVTIDDAININEYDNIESATNYSHERWAKMETLEDAGYQFFDGTVRDKTELGMPYPNEVRVIFYESCRGLEAWSTVCFNLDKFFSEKENEEDAEKFLIESEKDSSTESLFISNEERKKMFAATWALMAMTRAIDTLYISIDNPHSEFAQLIERYISSNSGKVKVLR